MRGPRLPLAMLFALGLAGCGSSDGNTSGAAVAIALAEAVESGRVQRGDLVLLLAFGAGLTWAAAIIEW